MTYKVDTDFIWICLKGVFDPEVGVNIVDLGLVYDVSVVYKSDNHFVVNIKMTLTSPTCPLADVIIEDIKRTISMIDCCKSVEVEIVFDPPWHRDMITENGKMELGLF